MGRNQDKVPSFICHKDVCGAAPLQPPTKCGIKPRYGTVERADIRGDPPYLCLYSVLYLIDYLHILWNNKTHKDYFRVTRPCEVPISLHTELYSHLSYILILSVRLQWPDNVMIRSAREVDMCLQDRQRRKYLYVNRSFSDIYLSNMVNICLKTYYIVSNIRRALGSAAHNPDLTSSISSWKRAKQGKDKRLSG